MLACRLHEPRFSALSFGFRPGRGCHSALREITHKWRGVKWFIEGDIKGCFDNIDHDVLLSILRESIHDNRLIRLVSSMLRAGYFEDWRYNKTLRRSCYGGEKLSFLKKARLQPLCEYLTLDAEMP
ncbi:reverse transcriptase/maturase family protein [Salmonella enterica]|uniref:reverse transcriptase/maturase family protein n=1 Tax=Salmonella enterica TaxID=28901 RepID=UPI003D31BAE9